MGRNGRSKQTDGGSRKLSKKNLGGAIFGCTKETMQECLEKQLFGLPASHFTFVRNVEPGLPLFLFNYSDRRMHGIYAAASVGQMNIDPYAWTNGGMEKTIFPAQVQTYASKQCQPLLENEFKKAIADNYYSRNHFYFELDHGQTQALITLFKPLPILNVIKQAPGSSTKTKSSLPIEANSWIPIGNSENMDPIGHKLEQKVSIDFSSRDTSQPLSCGYRDTELGTPSKKLMSAQERGDSSSQYMDMGGAFKGNFRVTDTSVDRKGKRVVDQSRDNGLENVNIVLHKLQGLSAERSDLPSKICKEQCNEDTLLSESLVSAEVVEKDTVSYVQVNAELLELIGELLQRTSVLEKNLAATNGEAHELRSLVMESGRTIHSLENRVVNLESQLQVSTYLGGGINNDVNTCSKNVIYLIGGHDGNSCLSSLDSFSPSEGKLRSLKSMSYPRSLASAVALDGNIFVFGGRIGDSEAWCSTVECYNPMDNKWTSCAPLNRAKGSLGGARIDKKIFAIGGADSNGPASDVQMFDFYLGKWITAHSLIHKRFATAAAELDGALYAVGGYDGESYLASVERYDPREGYWVMISNMSTRRGSHSLAVLNQKMYAIGGYDGCEMKPIIEFFDPRLQTWTLAEPMTYGRGYAATAVLDDALYTIGGSTTAGVFCENVECYREGSGWNLIPSWKIGKRRFFSAAVI